MAVVQDRSFGARLAAVGFDAFCALMRALPVDAASDLGASIAKALGPLTPSHRVARFNIARAFPDLAPADLDRMLVDMWDNLGRVAAEFPLMDRIRADGPDPRIEVVNPQGFHEPMAAGRGAVLISGHFANWEAAPAAVVQCGVDCNMTYRPANNGFIDDRIVAQRAAYGVKLQAAKGREGGMGLLRSLAKGRAVGLMNDQKYAEGALVPFFGHPAQTADGPARLARKYGAPIVPVSVVRTHKARFRVTVHPPIAQSQHSDEETAIAETVATITRWVEDRIREAPSQWFWVHRRWPKDHYRQTNS